MAILRRGAGGPRTVIFKAAFIHALAEILHAYINAAGMAETAKAWLFRTFPRARRQYPFRSENGTAGRLAHDPPTGESRRHRGPDRNHIARHGDHRLSRKRRRSPSTRRKRRRMKARALRSYTIYGRAPHS